MFSHNTDDLQYLFESLGQSVLINNVEKQVILTNPPLAENEERYIYSTERVSQGNLVVFDGENYLTITESISKRYGKYKAKIKHCNFIIQVPGETVKVLKGYDSLGRPVYEYIAGDPYYIPSIVEFVKFNVIQGAITTAENEIKITVQDNELNRTKFVVNFVTNVMDYNWKVRNIDKTKRGLLVLTCEKVIV